MGFGPLTEPEALALYNFTLENNFSLILAYHTQGKEIYWQFQNYAPEDAEEIGNIFASLSGYTLADVPYNSSFAGYKDWFLQQYRKPGYTIEAGIGENPLPISQFDEIYNNNIGILVIGSVLSALAPTPSYSGGSGGSALSDYYVHLYATFVNQNDVDLAISGKPYGKYSVLKDFSGYVQTHDAHVATTATDIQTAEIDNQLNSGIYIE